MILNGTSRYEWTLPPINSCTGFRSVTVARWSTGDAKAACSIVSVSIEIKLFVVV